ncbi:MAG: hypothetical protein GY797_33415 [Deltaproteobacteria bacterium]|nr:hypothetical protein [Deltaproteobacteria bacterium]
MGSQSGQASGQVQEGQQQVKNDLNASGDSASILNDGNVTAQGEGQNKTGSILGAGDNNDSQNDSAGQQQGAPDKYEPFTLGDNLKMEDTQIEGFSAVAKELNLSQEQAQKLVDFQSAIVKENHDSKLQESEDIIELWKQDSIKMLGENRTPQLAIAKKLLSQRPELGKVLDDTGLINNQNVLKLLIDYGRLTSEDTLKDGLNSGETNVIPREKRMFPNMSDK